MCTGTRGSENEIGAIDTINQKPIRLDMTFSMAAIIANKLVVSHCFRKSLTRTKATQGLFELTYIPAALLCKLIVLLKLGSVLKRVHHGLVLIQGSYHRLYAAKGTTNITACHRIVHRRKRLRGEAFRVSRIER